jgi:hypothetical protein
MMLQIMARQPESGTKAGGSDALTREQIEELRRNLARLSTDSVERFYREAHAECAVERKPSAKLIQRLVTAWRVLRKWNWR